MNPTYDFSGQVTPVTGAASGRGQTTVRAFAESGAPVVLADCVHQAAKEIPGRGGRATGARRDVTDEQQVAAAVRAVMREYRRRLNMAVDNAGHPGAVHRHGRRDGRLLPSGQRRRRRPHRPLIGATRSGPWEPAADTERSGPPGRERNRSASGHSRAPGAPVG